MIYFLLLLNKTWSTSTMSCLLESTISEMFPVRLRAWLWLYILGLLFREAEDDIKTPLYWNWNVRLRLPYTLINNDLFVISWKVSNFDTNGAPYLQAYSPNCPKERAQVSRLIRTIFLRNGVTIEQKWWTAMFVYAYLLPWS